MAFGPCFVVFRCVGRELHPGACIPYCDALAEPNDLAEPLIEYLGMSSEQGRGRLMYEAFRAPMSFLALKFLRQLEDVRLGIASLTGESLVLNCEISWKCPCEDYSKVRHNAHFEELRS